MPSQCTTQSRRLGGRLWSSSAPCLLRYSAWNRISASWLLEQGLPAASQSLRMVIPLACCASDHVILDLSPSLRFGDHLSTRLGLSSVIDGADVHLGTSVVRFHSA